MSDVLALEVLITGSSSVLAHLHSSYSCSRYASAQLGFCSIVLAVVCTFFCFLDAARLPGSSIEFLHILQEQRWEIHYCTLTPSLGLKGVPDSFSTHGNAWPPYSAVFAPPISLAPALCPHFASPQASLFVCTPYLFCVLPGPPSMFTATAPIASSFASFFFLAMSAVRHFLK